MIPFSMIPKLVLGQKEDNLLEARVHNAKSRQRNPEEVKRKRLYAMGHKAADARVNANLFLLVDTEVEEAASDDKLATKRRAYHEFYCC